MLNGFAFALLLTSLFVLRFRGWTRPRHVIGYFAFFAALEMVANHYFFPAGALGPEVAVVCFALTVPVSIAAWVLWRHEKTQAARGPGAGV